MKSKFFNIPFNRPFIVGRELYYIAQAVLMNRHISGDGPFTEKCNAWIEKALGCPRSLLTHSCTAALEMAAILCDIGPGDEVIMPSFTFVSTANAVVLRGGVPVFIDIRPDTLNMDETLIQKAVTDKTKAVLPVHYAGMACAMNEIMDLAEQNRLWIIEDAAQGFLSTYNGQYLGTIGHLGCLSFHETKNVISGEGGALLVNDPKLIERAEIIREKGTNRNEFFRGRVDKYTWLDIGSSFLPSDLVSAFLFAQLEQAETINRARRQVFERYREGLSPLEEKGRIGLPPCRDDCVSNGHLFYIITKNHDERARLMTGLDEIGINSVFHYIPLHSSPAGKKYGRAGSAMTHTDDLSNRLLRLPLYFEMTGEEVDNVVTAIHDFYSRV